MARRTRLTRRRRTRRRGGADKGETVAAILAIIKKTPPDKLHRLKNAADSIEPLAFKAGVADAANEAATPEDGVAKITALLMNLDETKLTDLKTALETASMKGGDPPTPEETAAILQRRADRIAASKARIAAANRPLSTQVKSGIMSSGQGAFRALLFVLAGAVSSIGGHTRRRRA